MPCVPSASLSRVLVVMLPVLVGTTTASRNALRLASPDAADYKYRRLFFPTPRKQVMREARFYRAPSETCRPTARCRWRALISVRFLNRKVIRAARG
ncbi:hypothetical protein PUN28_018283 [Cardiocondyla obscurior]|uniref:Secreted protein n=1 Tax=Cardiocondyla obscurior TaxID=286306 RepID=A0AAW2EGP8_9HYME